MMLTRVRPCTVCLLILGLSSLRVLGLGLEKTADSQPFQLISRKEPEAQLLFDPQEAGVVATAAALFGDDLERVTGKRLQQVGSLERCRKHTLILAGTLGASKYVQELLARGKLHGLEKLKGRWETSTWQLVEKPFPGINQALVIVGSDPRGTAYGLMKMSELVGVSPWYWWADVPVTRKDALTVFVHGVEQDAPAVPYRGIFINDEDWGLHPWAAKTFEPEFGGVGPKTYARVFELMLRLRLNYLWPAMHGCSKEFGLVPENYELAERYGIVAGSSHCEPMLCNNIHWDSRKSGPWNYSLNRGTIRDYWTDTLKKRGKYEAVWTIGIRGIHDQGMERPPHSVADRVKLLEEVFREQRDLLAQYTNAHGGSVPQCFVPYKEVLPLYEAGLKVPEDVTLVWVDDNFGYIRRLGLPSEKPRSGGAGVYWHLSYYGGPHSYLWINTTAPALMWEELHKAWENDARRLWVINVGDIKPMELGIDFFARLSWAPEGFGPDCQPRFLKEVSERLFGAASSRELAALLTEFYRLGTVRKPELMNRAWACSLTEDAASALSTAYQELLRSETAVAKNIPVSCRDAYFETVGFPAQALAASGLIFLHDRALRVSGPNPELQAKIEELRKGLEQGVQRFNEGTAGGKWRHMMPGLVTAEDLTRWNSQVRWPWGEKEENKVSPAPREQGRWRSMPDRTQGSAAAAWKTVFGLGASGNAHALKPASRDLCWDQGDPKAPVLEYDFENTDAQVRAVIDFLPTFRICAGMKLRVQVSVDGGKGTVVEVPGSGGTEDEYGNNRVFGVQNNYVRVEVPLRNLGPGKHCLRISAMDPGVVIDRVLLP